MSSPPTGGSSSKTPQPPSAITPAAAQQPKEDKKQQKKKAKSQPSSSAAKRQLVQQPSSPAAEAGPSSAARLPAKQRQTEDIANKTANNNRDNNNRNPKDKSCCFCWCCCCSCSCLSVHNQMKERALRMHQLGPDGFANGADAEAPPSLEEIRSWGESFDRLMRCAAGRKVFRDFLRCEYSEENILFWLACEELKREKAPEVVEEKARSIYEDYVSILSPKEVSLDSKVRDVVNRNMVHPTKNTFDEAQLQIYTLMHRDSYPRFVGSPLYRRMAQLSPPTPPTRKTSISVG